MEAPDAVFGSDGLVDDNIDEVGGLALLDLLLDLEPFLRASWAATLEPIAPRAERALEVVDDEDELLDERLVATPLRALSDSCMGSLLTNSFCSNWTTT